MTDNGLDTTARLRRGEYRLRKIGTWLRYRWAVASHVVPRHWLRRGPDGLPLPPGGFIHAVSGSYDAGWFLKSGALGYTALISALRDVNPAAEDIEMVLDFGCGCGRVARHWPLNKPLQFHGVDTNPHLVHWCQKNLEPGRFTSNAPDPPLVFEPETFDLIYAFSVLTHLGEQRQMAWMTEFERLLRPSGWLVVSTHGEHAARLLPAPEREDFNAGRLVVTTYGTEGGNDWNAFHPRRYFEDVTAAAFECVEFRAEGALGNPPQDLFVLRRRSSTDEPSGTRFRDRSGSQ